MLSAEMVRLLGQKRDALWADAKRVKDPFILQESGNDIGMLLDDRAELLKILDGYHLGGDCLICPDTAAEHESRVAGCPCCWTAAKRTMVEVMRWSEDNGRAAGRAELLALLQDLDDFAAAAWTELIGKSFPSRGMKEEYEDLCAKLKAVLPADDDHHA